MFKLEMAMYKSAHAHAHMHIFIYLVKRKPFASNMLVFLNIFVVVMLHFENKF